ncbi:30S ribosomal protein S21 [Candidatus Daviesbacteria bacterium]|nr:30S ribosomal protein S21 [Candidatus Daviesbacteria bacterium]
MSAVFVKAKPNESTDKLIARFKRKVQDDLADYKKRQHFVSKTEERLIAEKEKKRKIAKLKRLQEKGLI